MNAPIRLTFVVEDKPYHTFMLPDAISGFARPTPDDKTSVYAKGEADKFVAAVESPEQIASLIAVAMHGYALTDIVKPGDLIEYVYWDTEDVSGIPQPAIKLLEKTYRSHR